MVAKNASLALLRDTERMVVCVAESASAESSSGSCAVFDDKDDSEHRAIMSILTTARQRPPSLVRFLPVCQYLLELASGVWVLECGVLTSREA